MEELMNKENTVITYTDYRQYKAELDAELEKSAESFIRIGYLLKVARDTGILKESGYASVNEFAQKEYGLDKTQVSRFMRINDRFSKDGYAETLKEEYKGFGYAKLSIMLQLPDSINEELSPEYSKTEIQAIKDECDEEEKITDLEVMMEKRDEVQQELDGILQKVVYQIGKEDSRLYAILWESLMANNEQEREFMEHLAPSGMKTYSIRIPGTGRMMLMIKESEEEVKLLNVREPEDKRIFKRTELVEAFRSIFLNGDAKTSWERTYGEQFPEEKKEVAPVQPKKESKVVKAKPADKLKEKADKVQDAAVKEEKDMTLHDVEKSIPEPEQVQEEETGQQEKAEEAAVNEEEGQIEGQSEISDFPEYMPEKEENLIDKQMELQKRAYELVKMTLVTRIEIWRDKQMPLEAVQKSKQSAEELLEIFEEIEKIANMG